VILKLKTYLQFVTVINTVTTTSTGVGHTHTTEVRVEYSNTDGTIAGAEQQQRMELEQHIK
jgi:hypothetical protein